MFWQNKHDKTNNPNTHNIDTAEYVRCLKRLAELDSAVEVLTTKVESIKTNMENLRGIVNRKLGGVKIEDQEEKKVETINKEEYVAFG